VSRAQRLVDKASKALISLERFVRDPRYETVRLPTHAREPISIFLEAKTFLSRWKVRGNPKRSMSFARWLVW
jgi:hypothetical protein